MIYLLQNYLASAGRGLIGSSGSRLVPGVASRLVHLAGSPIVRETAPLLRTLIWILSASELLVSRRLSASAQRVLEADLLRTGIRRVVLAMTTLA